MYYYWGLYLDDPSPRRHRPFPPTSQRCTPTHKHAQSHAIFELPKYMGFHCWIEAFNRQSDRSPNRSLAPSAVTSLAATNHHTKATSKTNITFIISLAEIFDFPANSIYVKLVSCFVMGGSGNGGGGQASRSTVSIIMSWFNCRNSIRTRPKTKARANRGKCMNMLPIDRTHVPRGRCPLGRCPISMF